MIEFLTTVLRMYNLRIIIRKLSKSSKAKPILQSVNLGVEQHPFELKRAIVLTKLSRFEYLKRQHRNLSESQLESYLRERGTDYDLLLTHHNLHKKFEENVKTALLKQGVETKVVDRFNYSEEQVSWADIVFAAGGDGTFLLAASRVSNNLTPVVGLNSDPGRSEGRLCLSPECSKSLETTINKLKYGEFKWKFRSRIRITMKGKEIFQSPTELHEQEMLEPQHRFFDYMTEQEKLRATKDNTSTIVSQHRLPILALNEVFIGEKLSARVSYFEMRVNKNPCAWRVKSSGLCITTGTGSTSWHLSMNRLTEQSVRDIIDILMKEGLIAENVDDGLACRVSQAYNDALAYSSDDDKMCYTIRDLISAEVWPSPKGIPPRGYVSRLEVRSRCYDAGLVVDGTVFFNFNDGTNVILETYPEDSLRTITLV